MPYYQVPARITRNPPVTGVITDIRPVLPPFDGPGCGDTTATHNQLPANDATSTYVWCTADPIPGLTPLTRAARDTAINVIASLHGRDPAKARADADRWQADVTAARDRTPPAPRARR